MNKPKILLIDIETSFLLAQIWSLWNANTPMDRVIQDTHVLCWCAKWLDSDEYYVDSLHYHKLYDKDKTNDKKVLESLWKLLDEADVVIGHNGDNFDIKTLNSRFVQQGMMPPSAYRTMDTLKIAKSNFKFTSNRLDNLGRILGVGRKVDTGGFSLWQQIVQYHNRKAFDKMVEYNEQDVFLLEEVYNKLKAWDKKHIIISNYGDLEYTSCTRCGSTHIKRNGHYYTNTQKYQMYYCKDCGGSMRSSKAEKRDKGQKLNLLRGI